MNEDFVSFDLAKKLKEKGLNFRTRYGYLPPIKLVLESFNYKDWSESDGYPAPTISQVLKWLREEKGISLNVYPSYFANLLYWTCDVISFIGEISIEKRLGGDVKTYEEAALAGITWALDNLI